MPTLKDVAMAAGVSTVTASSVLSGANRVRVSAATQERIMGIAKEMNYVPRAAARGLRTGRAQAIAFLTSGHTQSRWQPYWQDMLRGVSDVLWNRDEQLVLSMPRNQEHEIELLRRLAFGHQVDGLVIQDATDNDERIQLLRESGIPFVVLRNNPIATQSFNLVAFDIQHFSKMLVEHMCRQFGAIALLAGPKDAQSHQAYIDACGSIVPQRGRPYHEWTGAYLPDTEWFKKVRASAGEYPLGLLLTRHLLPEVMTRIQEADLRLGTDVHITYLSGGERSLVPLAGIDVIALDYYTLGRRAAQRLFDLIDNAEARIENKYTLVVPSTLEHLIPESESLPR